MKGPFPIFCRGHSGSRMLCEALRQNGLWMGLCDTRTRDSIGFAQRLPEVRELIEAGFGYHQAGRDEQQSLQRKLRALVDASRRSCPDPEDRPAYGWKRPITTFTIDIFFDAFPDGKVIHLLRDGRDCMLSRLDARMAALHDPLNRRVVFGKSGVTEYRGAALTPETIERFRNEIEMLHWVTVVSFALRGRGRPDRYLEVRYEDLCRHPVRTLGEVFDFLGVPYRKSARDWIAANASTEGIGKWRGREGELADAIKLGEPLLRELGYW